MFRRMIVTVLIIVLQASLLNAQQESGLVSNTTGRKTSSLNGKWQYIIDPYETGYYDYRYKERREDDPEAYWSSEVLKRTTERKEYGYINQHTLNVPGDWNSQDAKFLYYEGTVWYKKTFDYKKEHASNKVFLHFNAVNYRADVYLNGKKLGMHVGGFTPFNFEIPDSLLKAQGNFLVVKADNKRHADDIPTLNTDWWNYGGIIREVNLVELPGAFISNYNIHLRTDTSADHIEGIIKISSGGSLKTAMVEIPALQLKSSFPVVNGSVTVSFKAVKLQRWSPGDPKLYRVIITAGTDRIEDKIGFRTIEVKGDQVLLNGKRLFMRGISVHAEMPGQMRRAWSKQDALQLLGWAKELSCNMVRLAHYPHDETMTRMADSLGILVWSEIPVYWTIDFGNAEVLAKAKQQLSEMINRDQNRAAVIIWSVGNETPVSNTRTNFMGTLLEAARQMDSTRLITAALEVSYRPGNDHHVIDDPLGKLVDFVAFNEYLGWYSGSPASCRTAEWSTIYHKPLFISETGSEALGNYHSESLAMWSEEYQALYYKEQLSMMDRMPAGFTGMSPWILVDFRSPRRNNPVFQNGWNNKGLIDPKGHKKKAFYLLKAYYERMKSKYD